MYFDSILDAERFQGEMSGLRTRCRKIWRCQNKTRWSLGQLALEGMLAPALTLPDLGPAAHQEPGSPLALVAFATLSLTASSAVLNLVAGEL